MKILLPKGCSCSQLKVFSSNWNTKKEKVNTNKIFHNYLIYFTRIIGNF